MKAQIVVGTGFGDEGKGMTTDFLCSHSDCVVVRFNGGHQAGHTVIRDNVKHVHSSYGSGTLLGKSSYISEYCCFYPPYIETERDVLSSKGVTPTLYIHPLAKLTTPYDIAYNRVRELRLNHGSVGVGIGATFERNSNNYKLHAADIMLPTLLATKLEQIKWYYDTLLIGYSDEQMEYYLKVVKEEFEFFYKALACKSFKVAGYEYLKQFPVIVFEGAQGIMLDMDFGTFPNVTYSYCTSKNAIQICRVLNISDIEIHYVTRCYQTRHGNGWMSNENKISLINNEEEINVTDEWQGSLRIGELDTRLLNYAMNCDDIYSFDYEKHLHITCLDQRPGFSFPYSKLIMPFKSIREQFSARSESISSKPTEVFLL